MSYFTYNGTDSRNYGVVHFTPLPPKAAEVTESVELLGRSENFVRHTERYENIEIPFTIGFKDRQKLREIYLWLKGTGELIIGERPDEIYKVKSIRLDPERVGLIMGRIQVVFICSPFAYFKNPTIMNVTDFNATTLIKNEGNIFCEPLMRFKMNSAECTLNVNGKVITIKMPDGCDSSCDIILDCAEEIAYFQGPESGIFSCMQYVYGDLPLFHTGDNYILSTGMSELTINARERWL